MARYHISRLGSMASGDLEPDLDGYVQTSIPEVLAGSWESGVHMTRDMAREVAARNRAATWESERAIREWRRA